MSQEEARLWKGRINAAFTRDKRWQDKADRIVKRYRGNQDDLSLALRRFNILWSNVQTLLPALYGNQPVPVCERRFLDADPVGKAAAMILERALRYEIEDNGFHDAIEAAVLDLLLPGRGTVWVRFVPEFGEPVSIQNRGDDELDPDGEAANDPYAEEEAAENEESQPLVGACVAVEYQHWRDLVLSDARVWDEVEWIARRVYMSRVDLIERFGDKVGKQIALDHTPEQSRKSGNVSTDNERQAKATVYEVWCKYDRTVLFVAEGYDDLIEKQPDPLHLEGFWPMPRPLFATLTHDSLTPVPDYVEYMDQALELDMLTQRISLLEKALKVSGVYDAGSPGIRRMLQENAENQLIPVENWAAFAEKGGLSGAVSWLPIADVATVLERLINAREVVKQDLYEITGLSDIIRGSSDPGETATAQQIKGNFASQRLAKRQREVARYARDVVRIMGEVIAEHFPADRVIQISSALYDDGIIPPEAIAPQGQQAPSPQPLQMPSGLPPGMPLGVPDGMGQPGLPGPAALPPPQAPFDPQAARMEMIQRALGLLRDEKQRGFRIDIETDSTVAVDAGQEKEQVVEFMTAATTYIEKAATVGAQYPPAVPILGKMLLFGLRRFRIGRDLESSFEEFIDVAQRSAQAAESNAGNEQPSPEQIKAQAEIEKAQLEAQTARQQAQVEREKMAMQMEAARQEHQYKMEAMQRQAQIDAMNHDFAMQKMAMQPTMPAVQGTA